MTEPLRLEAQDPEVWRLTLDALEASADVAPTAVKCRRGGCLLGHAGMTKHGPLFVSSWPVERDVHVKVIVNGRKLSRAAAIKAHDAIAPVAERSGKPIDHLERYGTIALLALPPEMAQDYPDLMVRCKHGDAVLDRRQVIEWVRTGRASKVEVSVPRLPYARVRKEGAITTTSREVRKLGPATRRDGTQSAT